MSNSIVHIFQIFYKEHIYSFSALHYFITGNYFYVNLRECFFLKTAVQGALCPTAGAHLAFSWRPFVECHEPRSSALGRLSPLEFRLEKGCGGSDLPETIPLVGSDVRGL